MNWVDPVVQEVRKAREKLWKECHYNLDLLCSKMRREQASSGLRVVSKSELPRKRYATSNKRLR
jgi:hypothetical protein